MAALKRRFLERLAAEQPRLAAGEAEAVHRLAGAAGVFGFDALGRAAQTVDAAHHAGQTPGAEALAALAYEIDRVLKHG